MIAELIKIESDLNLKVGVDVNDNTLQYKRKMTVIPFKGCVIARNELICNMEGRQQEKTYDILMNFKMNNYKVSFWEQASNIGTATSTINMIGSMIQNKSIDAISNAMLPKIYDANGNLIGNVEYEAVKGEKMMQTYNYYKISLRNIELKCYTIGHGRKEIFFAMYDMQDRLVAEVSKRMQVKNGKSSYTMYISNDGWFEHVAIATIILHQMQYDKEEDNITLGSQGYALNTFQEGLLNKYNPDFINTIIANENPKNLPENMPLVMEKIKESQNTPILWYRRIASIAFIIFILIFLFIFFKK